MIFILNNACPYCNGIGVYCNIFGEFVKLHAATSKGQFVGVEVKRHATVAAIEQLSRYLVYLNRDPLLAPVRGVLAAQTVTPQARVLAEDRGVEVRLLDYDAMRGIKSNVPTLF